MGNFSLDFQVFLDRCLQVKYEVCLVWSETTVRKYSTAILRNKSIHSRWNPFAIFWHSIEEQQRYQKKDSIKGVLSGNAQRFRKAFDYINVFSGRGNLQMFHSVHSSCKKVVKLIRKCMFRRLFFTLPVMEVGGYLRLCKNEVFHWGFL